eukprot:19316-Heterococcus_DN1.PRE.1
MSAAPSQLSELSEVDRLRSKGDDPEKTLYVSKYTARQLLEDSLKALPGGEAALSPEDLVRVCHRLGCIGSDTEENHVAEARWQQGLELLFPGLVQRIATAAGDEHAPEPPPEAEPVAQPPVPTAAPSFSPTQLSYAVPIEAMDMLSHCGILWAQRGCPRKALMYLLAASSFYETLSTAQQQRAATAINTSSSAQDSSNGASTAGATAATAGATTAGAGAEAVSSDSAAAASDTAVDVDDVTLQLQQQQLQSNGSSTTAPVDSCSSNNSSGELDSATWSAIEVLQTHVLFFLAQFQSYALAQDQFRKHNNVRLVPVAHMQFRCAVKRTMHCSGCVFALTYIMYIRTGSQYVWSTTPDAAITTFRWRCVYHHFNDAAKSCECCINTLQRQLAAGWKNPSAPVTITTTVNRLDAAGHCLMAAQTVLQSVQQQPGAISACVKDAVIERTAELEKRFGELYVMVLQMKCDEMTLVSELLAEDKQLGVTAAAAKARHMTAQLCSGNTVDGTSTAAGASVTPKFVIPGAGSLHPPLSTPAEVPSTFEGVLPVFKLAVNGHLKRALDYYVLD